MWAAVVSSGLGSTGDVPSHTVPPSPPLWGKQQGPEKYSLVCNGSTCVEAQHAATLFFCKSYRVMHCSRVLK